ncbi:MAG: LacI family transcriptional regulator, partial [Crenarchaeota archaeon]|nr:LacI family transcriptional regulator [Thermoproteota archaeon]
ELRVKFPVVLVDYSLTDFFSIVSDNEGGAFEATGHLASLGHRKIACLTVPSFGNNYPLRVEGYRKALEAFSISDAFVFRQDKNESTETGMNAMEELGHKACRKMLKSRKGITGIFAVSDAVAIGAMEALREEKIKVPEEMSIVGFDGIYDAVHTDPPLTTMHVHKEKMGRLAVKTLLDNINNRNANPKEIVLSPHLVIRASAAPPEKVV